MDYKISAKTAEIMAKLTELPEVKAGLQFLVDDHERAINEQLELVVIKAPTFFERERAEHYEKMMRAEGLDDVHIDRHNNVIGVKKGSGGGPSVLIEGHLDTVFDFDVEINPVIKDGKIYAPGIGDDTRGLAAVLSTLRAFNATGIQHKGDIYFAGIVREEGMGGLSGMKDFLEDNKGKIDATISIDGAGNDRIVHNATGMKTMSFTFYGIGGHAFGAFAKVANPLHAAARAVAKIADIQVPENPKTTFAVSNFHAGTDAAIHAITENATIKINFRSNGLEELQQFEKELFRCVEEACREETERWGKDTITFSHECYVDVPAGTQDKSSPILEATYAAMEHLGIVPKFVPDGCTNANIPICLGMPAVCIGRGGNEGGVHTTGEWFEIEGSYRCTQEAFLIALAVSGIKDKTESVL